MTHNKLNTYIICQTLDEEEELEETPEEETSESEEPDEAWDQEGE